MRQREYIRTRYRALLGYIGALIVVIGGIYLLPLLVLFFHPAEVRYAPAFAGVSVVMMAGGLVAWWRFAPEETGGSMTMQESAIVITATWLVAVISGALPLWVTGLLPWHQALFESTSGWTTTGLSFVDVTTAPQVMLFYRSVLQLAGGAGLAIVALTAISGPVTYGLSVMEGRSEKLAPHVRRSANLVLILYSSYVVLGVLGLWVAGMGWFDAVNHAFTAVATGGFSTRPESIGYWDSLGIESVIIVLMILGNINFLTAWTLLRGKFNAVHQNAELRVLALLTLVAVVLLFFLVTVGVYATAGKSVRVALFESVSAITGTGFSTVPYLPWSDFGWLVLISLMIAGGGSGSTAGGIKQFRVFIMFRAIQWEIREAFMPQHAVNEPMIWQGERLFPISDERVRQVALFIGLYLGVFLLGTGVMAAHGYSLRESLFEFASTLGTVGLSVGVTSSDTPLLVVWTQIAAMLLGRLEFFAVIIGVTKIWKDAPHFIGNAPRPSP